MVLGNLSTVFALVYWRFLFFGLFTLSSVLEVKLKESNRLFVCQFQVEIDVCSFIQKKYHNGSNKQFYGSQTRSKTLTHSNRMRISLSLSPSPDYAKDISMQISNSSFCCICIMYLRVFIRVLFLFFAFFVVTINLTKS